MPVLTYLDFDLLIERAGDRYRARVLSSPGGNASRTFDLPFSREQLQIFVLTATGHREEAEGAAHRVAGDAGDQDLRQSAVRGGVRRRGARLPPPVPARHGARWHRPADPASAGRLGRRPRDEGRRDRGRRDRRAVRRALGVPLRLGRRRLPLPLERVTRRSLSGSPPADRTDRGATPASDPRHDLRTERRGRSRRRVRTGEGRTGAGGPGPRRARDDRLAGAGHPRAIAAPAPTEHVPRVPLHRARRLRPSRQGRRTALRDGEGQERSRQLGVPASALPEPPDAAARGPERVRGRTDRPHRSVRRRRAESPPRRSQRRDRHAVRDLRRRRDRSVVRVLHGARRRAPCRRGAGRGADRGVHPRERGGMGDPGALPPFPRRRDLRRRDPSAQAGRRGRGRGRQGRGEETNRATRADRRRRHLGARKGGRRRKDGRRDEVAPRTDLSASEASRRRCSRRDRRGHRRGRRRARRRPARRRHLVRARRRHLLLRSRHP